MAAASLFPLRSLTLLAASLALVGCGDSVETPIDPQPVEELAPVPDLGPVQQEEQVTDPVTLDDCNARLAQPFIGREADLDTRIALLEAVSPIQNVRWIGPGDDLGDNIEPMRLVVRLDASEVITSVGCG